MILRNKGSEASIIMTQPRRISAIGVAERIASERCEHVGETIGYSIRLESKKSSKTRLLLCTTGILLRRLQCDPGKRKDENVSFQLHSIHFATFVLICIDLASVSHVFVDEVSFSQCTHIKGVLQHLSNLLMTSFYFQVHERDINTDFLLIILKDLLLRRKNLKLVLMSATLNADTFSTYFEGCPTVSIPGRTFPVKENRLEGK